MTLFVYVAIAIVLLFTTVAVANASTGGSDVSNVSDKITKFAGAIAFAEGYWDRNNNVHTNSRPARDNNPGDFEGSGDAGSDGVYAKYSTIDAGWKRLYHQLQIIVDGTSDNYNLDMTISDMAYTYTATQQDAWAENVASYVGATRDTPLRGLLT